MVHIENAVETIRGEAAERLIQFCMNNSRHIILSRKHEEEIPDIDALIEQTIQREKEQLKEQTETIHQMSGCQLRREMGLCSRSAVLKALTETAKERIRIIEAYRSLKSQQKDRLMDILASYGIEKRTISIGSFVAFPGIFDLCYFPKDAAVIAPLKENLFAHPVSLEGYDFEDVAFEDAMGRVWMQICSQKNSFIMRLEEEKYKAFENLRISHTII